MEWKTVEGYQEARPKEIDMESSPTTVYLRRNVTKVKNAEGEGTHWRYEEAEISRNDTAAIQTVLFEKQKAMDEVLAEILLNQMEE